jgi:hypothetical protein
MHQNFLPQAHTLHFATTHIHTPAETMGKIDARLAELGLELPVAGEPKGAYVNVVRSGNYIYTGACGMGDALLQES